jgi:tetratricopeptide (TPR) repeat protein
MLSGRAAFTGTSTLQVYHSVVYDQPPALSGPAPVPALDTAVRRALAKSPQARYQSAEEMAGELKQLLAHPDAGAPARACPARRLIVLPFRLLAQSRRRFSWLQPGRRDRRIAVGASVADRAVQLHRDPLRQRDRPEENRVRSGGGPGADREPAGRRQPDSDQRAIGGGGHRHARWSQTSQGSLRDIFELQDQVVQRVVGSLPLSLTGREQELLRRDVPASPTAYEYYLRANQVAYSYGELTVARDLYLRSVEADPGYAPAWARLGRCHRVIAKFGQDVDSFTRAGAALQRALELNPDLPVAHNLMAQLDADMGRAQEAAVRRCDYERALETSRGVHHYVGPLALVMLGRNEEAASLSRAVDLSGPLPALARYAYASVRALAEGNRAAALDITRQAVAAINHGPEELFYFARHLAFLEQPEEAVVVLARAIEQGFFCYPAFAADRWLDPLRARAGFLTVLQNARERHQQAARMFAEAGGERLLGVSLRQPLA